MPGQLRVPVDAQPDMAALGVAANDCEAVQLTLVLRPDVAVMDLSVPELNGVQATAQLHERDLGICVVALTSHRDRSYVAAVQATGGCRYEVKQLAGAVLLEAIRPVAARAAFEDPTLMAPGPLSSDTPPVPTFPDVPSAWERAVLQDIARGRDGDDNPERS